MKNHAALEQFKCGMIFCQNGAFTQVTYDALWEYQSPPKDIVINVNLNPLSAKRSILR